MPWTCSRCGEEHEGLPHDLAFDAPMHWDGGKSDNDELTDDLCVWTDDAGEPAFFIRGLLTLPVLDADDDFRFGVWSSLSGASFERIVELWDDPARIEEDPYFGWLSNSIPGYPDTVSLPLSVITGSLELRPSFLLHDGDHPLIREQREGDYRGSRSRARGAQPPPGLNWSASSGSAGADPLREPLKCGRFAAAGAALCRGPRSSAASSGRVQEIHESARRLHPGLLELRTVVGALHVGVDGRGGVVRDDVARRGEADDRQQMAVRSLEGEAVELARAERERRDERDARLDVLLGFGERAELRDHAFEPERVRVRDVERPVACAVVVVVVREARGVVDPRVLVVRVGSSPTSNRPASGHGPRSRGSSRSRSGCTTPRRRRRTRGSGRRGSPASTRGTGRITVLVIVVALGVYGAASFATTVASFVTLGDAPLPVSR